MEELIKLTGLWKEKDKNGDIILRGSLKCDTQIIIRPNTQKKDDSDPDFLIYIVGENIKKTENYDFKKMLSEIV